MLPSLFLVAHLFRKIKVVFSPPLFIKLHLFALRSAVTLILLQHKHIREEIEAQEETTISDKSVEISSGGASEALIDAVTYPLHN